MIGALCWVSGDLLLVGFEIKPERYPIFSERYAELLDPEIFTLMLEASTRRLLWGVLLATFSLWLYLLAVYSVIMSVSGWTHGRKLFVPLLFIFSLYPMAHGSFFFVGESAKLISSSPEQGQANLVQMAAAFQEILTIHWLAVVILSSAFWLNYGTLTVLGKTVLPRTYVLFNPALLTISLSALAHYLLPQPIQAWVGASVFNLALLIYFASLYHYWSKLSSIR